MVLDPKVNAVGIVDTLRPIATQSGVNSKTRFIRQGMEDDLPPRPMVLPIRA